MMLTKGALGNLINRYRAVLKKCALLNTFGSLAVAGMLVLGGVSGAGAEEMTPQWENAPTTPTTTINQPNQQNNVTDIEEGDTVVVDGANTYTGAETSSAIMGSGNNTAINWGKIWVISGEKNQQNGYAEGMGISGATNATIINKGTIYVDGRDAWKAKAMGVNPKGNAINQGIIIVKKGSGIADNSGSTEKTIKNDSAGKIYVTETGGIGIFHRKEALDTGDVSNTGAISASNGGIGVSLINDKNDDTYNNKFFSNSGTITADEQSKAILVKDTTGATIKLTNGSRITGLVDLAGTDNKLNITDVGTAEKTERLHVTSDDLANLNMVNSHIVFIDKSQFTLTGSSTIDKNSTVTMGNVTFAQGTTEARTSLISLSQGALTLNGGLKTTSSDSEAKDPIATLSKLEKTTTGTTLTGVDFQNHNVVENFYSNRGLIDAHLSKNETFNVIDSKFSENILDFYRNRDLKQFSSMISIQGIDTTSKVVIEDTSFVNNSYTSIQTIGGIVSAQNASVTLDNVEFIKNSVRNHWHSSIGGTYYQNQGELSIKNTSFEANSSTESHYVLGAGASLIGVKADIANTLFTGNSVEKSHIVYGGGLYLSGARWGGNSDISITITDSSFEKNSITDTEEAYGAGLYIKGDVNNSDSNGKNGKIYLTLNDVNFIENKALSIPKAYGGAVYAMGTPIVLNYNNDTLITGNTVSQNGTGGFLYLDSNTSYIDNQLDSSATFNIADKAILIIGAADADYTADNNLDSIAGVASAILTKQGAGTMVVNSLLSDFLGTVNVKAGTMQVAQAWSIANTVNVSGGTLDLANFDFGDNGTIALSATGTLKTGSANIFTAALDDAGTTVTDANTLKSNNITFTNGGIVALTDAHFNLAYAGSANTLVKNAGGKKVTMLGNLINDANGETVIDNRTSIDNLPDNAGMSALTLAKVEATTENKNLVIGGTGSGNDTGREHDLGIKSIDLGSASSVTVLGGKTLTLVGDGASDVIKTTAATGATVAINDGTLQLGEAGAESGGRLNANLSLGTNGTLTNNTGTFTVQRVAAQQAGQGTVRVADGNLNVTNDIGSKEQPVATVATTGGNISAGGIYTARIAADKGTVNATLIDLGADTTSLTHGAVITTDILTAASGTRITVGSTEGGAGTLVAKEANLNGASLFLDPAWINGMEYQEAASASRAAIKTFGASGVNGLLTVGQNSQLSLGTADVNWVTAAINDRGSTAWGEKGITAALGIYASQTLANTGGILVDGSITKAKFEAQGSINKATANAATFAANSLLVVNAPNMLEKAALAGDGSSSILTVEKDAELHIMNGKASDTVHIVSGFDRAGNTLEGWRGDNLTTDSQLLTATAGTFDKGAYHVTLSQNSATSIFPKLDNNLGMQIDGMVRTLGLNTHSNNYGQRFISRVVSDRYLGTSNAQRAAATIDGAAKIAFAGAAPQMAMNIATTAGNVSGLRNSLAATPQGVSVAMNNGIVAHEGLAAGDGLRTGFGLWVLPTFQNQQAFGLASGEFETGYKSNAAGVVLGADYTFNDMFRVGAQFNVGGGYAESSGDFNSTENRFNYWGLGLYAGYQYENIGITADFGYSSNNNKIEQTLPSSLQMPALKADAKSDTLTAGLRGEYKFATEALDIVPHIGVRMTNMHMGSFDIKSDKHKVFKADDVNATVWTFPVGVTFSKNIETGDGWTVKPSLDFAVVPAVGDIEAKQEVKIAGVSNAAQVESSIMDHITYQGSVGLSAKHDNGVSVGVNYTLQAGAHSTDHGLQATFRYEF